MRIAIVGAGAVGGYFGALLSQAGRDVTMLVRPGRAAAIRENGLVVRHLDGRLSRTDVATSAIGSIDGRFDVVVVAVKSFGLDQAMTDLGPAVGADTMILPLLNGVAHVDALQARFGADRVIGGVCLVATDLGADGVIQQVGPVASLSYGELDGSESDRIQAADQAFSGAGFDATASRTIELDMWEKWLLLAAGGALTTLLGGNVGEICAAPGGPDAASAMIAECTAVMVASGHAPRRHAVERATATLTAAGSSFTTSMYRDVLAGRAVEADHVVGDLVGRGARLGVPVPHLSLAHTALCVYQQRRRQFTDASVPTPR